MAKNLFPKILLAAYLALFSVCAISPYARDVWVAENLPLVIIVAVLFVLYRKGIVFSNTAYALMSVLIFLHTIGGHYTFERVPFDIFQNYLGFERNMYDRVAHFTVGFYAYAVMELSLRRKWVANTMVAACLALFAIMATAAFYEIIEWLFAVGTDPSAGGAFLGSQGDIWDAQKDMLLDTLGAAVAIGVFWVKGNSRAE